MDLSRVKKLVSCVFESSDLILKVTFVVEAVSPLTAKARCRPGELSGGF